MTKRHLQYFVIGLSLWLFGQLALANLPLPHGVSAVSLPEPAHCYHWLRTVPENLLEAKLNYANQNKGAFLHVEKEWTYGSGIYCGYSLLDSMEYGDRVIRIDLRSANADHIKNIDAEKRWFLISTSGYELDAQGQPKTFQTSQGLSKIVNTSTSILSWTANSTDLEKDITQTIEWLEQHKEDYPDSEAKLRKLKLLLPTLKKEISQQRRKTYFPVERKVLPAIQNIELPEE